MQTNTLQAPVVYTQWPNNTEPGRQFLKQIDQADQRVDFHPELPPILFSNTGSLYTGGFCGRVAGFKRPTREEPKVFNTVIKQRRGITGLRIPVTNFDLHLKSGEITSAFDLYFPPTVVKIKNRSSQRRRTASKPAAELRVNDLMLRIRIRQRRQGQLPVDAPTKVQGNSFPFTFTMPLPTVQQLVQLNHPAPKQAQLPPAGAPAAVARLSTSSRDLRRRLPATSTPIPTTYEAMVIEPSLPPARFALSFLPVPETMRYTSSNRMDMQEPWQNSTPSTSQTIGTHEAMLVDPSTSAPTPGTRLTPQGAASTGGSATTTHNPRHPAPTTPAPVTSETQGASFKSSSSKMTRFSSTSSVGPSYLPPATHFRSNTGPQQQHTGFSRWGGSVTPFSGSFSLATSFRPQVNTSTASFNGSAGPTNTSEGSTHTSSEGTSQAPITPATVHTGGQYGAGEAAPQEAEDEPEYPSSSDEDGSGDNESGAESGDEASEIGDDDGADVHEAEDEGEEEGQDEDAGETNGGDEHHGDADNEADEVEDRDQEHEDPSSDDNDDEDDDSDAAPVTVNPPAPGQSAYGASAGPSVAGRGAPVNLSSRSHSGDPSDDGSDDSDNEGPAKPLGLAAKIDLNDMIEDLLEDAKAQGMQQMQERSG